MGLISLDHCKRCVPGRWKRACVPGKKINDNVNALLVPGRRALMIKLPRLKSPLAL